ncbi:hypothetical protein [Larkinella terrae]|nr:hypothetical protein [Larkinella terrae]
MDTLLRIPQPAKSPKGCLMDNPGCNPGPPTPLATTAAINLPKA